MPEKGEAEKGSADLYCNKSVYFNRYISLIARIAKSNEK